MVDVLASRRLVRANVLVALWLTLLANASFFGTLYQLLPYGGLKAGLFLGSVVLVLWAYLNLLLQWLSWGPVGRTVLSLLLVIAALGAYAVDNFGVGIDTGQIQNLMQTDSREARDLLSLQLLGYVLVVAGVPMAWLWRAPLEPATLGQGLRGRLYASLASLAVVGLVAAGFYVDYAAVFREHRELRYLVNPVNSVNALVNYYQGHAVIEHRPLVGYGRDARRGGPSPGKPVLMVLVVGETARAESFGLNGYPRPTTPELARRDVINFSQVHSCGTATAVSLPCMFSGFTRADYDAELASHREGLLDIVQRAGFEVTWIDNNSGCKGACDRVHGLPLLPKLAAHFCENNECQDDLLVETLAEYLKDAPVRDRLIVLHQMGSHGPAYYRRYPKAFERFTPVCATNAIQGCSRDAVINTYDNTIAYTDHILARVIDLLAARADHYQTAFWYVSDHGESTGEHGLYLHGAPYAFAPSQQTHVPMVAWLSPEFAQRRGALRACLLQRRTQPLAHDHLFHTVLGLLDIRTAVHDRDLDLTAGCGPAGG